MEKDRVGCWCGHASDCAAHNEPAYPVGDCDCEKQMKKHGPPIKRKPRPK